MVVTTDTLAAVASFIVSIIAIAGVAIAGATRFAKIEVKVDTMWAFQMRRAVSEAVEGGLATLNSPLSFTAPALETLDPIAPQLRALGEKYQDASQLELAFIIEAVYGDELLERFCIPLRTSHGACVLAALEIAKGKPIDITFDPPTMPSLPLMALHRRERQM